MKAQRGFTLVELIIVLVLLGIIGMTVGSLYWNSISSYMNMVDSSAIVDDADSIQRRFFRDVRKTLPNSIRITSSGSKTFIELTPIITSGKYKALANSTSSANACAADDSLETDNDILSIGKTDTCFKTIGTLIDTSVVTPGTDSVVVYNIGGGDTTADVYVGGNRALISSVTDLTNETKIVFSSKTFSNQGTGDRFYITSQPVTYECDTTAKTLKRYSGYGFNSSQPTTFSVTGALMSKNIGSCVWTYSNLINIQRGIVTFKLGLSSGNASIMLVNSANVGNAP